MSFTELLEELDKLSPAELEAVHRKLDELQQSSVEETPELLAAIDEGIRSAEEGPLIPIEEVMKEVKSWNTKST
jgi:predicted transcriptional regulator